MPALMVWRRPLDSAQKMLGICTDWQGAFMIAAGIYALSAGTAVEFAPLFTLYTLSVAFYMPTIALSNSVAYCALNKAGLDTVKDFPPIRVFGTVGFICSMWAVDLLGFQTTPMQFVISGGLGILLALYAFTLPNCPVNKSAEKKSFIEALGLQAFSLLKKKSGNFFIFSMLLGYHCKLQMALRNHSCKVLDLKKICRHFLGRSACHILIPSQNFGKLLHSPYPVLH